MRVGDREGIAEVQVYETRRTPEGLRPGDHVAVPVRLSGGEMRRWRLSAAPEVYFITILPDSVEAPIPGIAVTGARCSPAFDQHSYWCLATNDAWVTVYHPQQIDPDKKLGGNLAIWRQNWRN